MWVYDLETLAFVEVNDAAVSRYGYSRAEFLCMRITDIRPEEDVARLEEIIRSGLPATHLAGVWRHRTKSGEIIDVEVDSEAVEFAGRPSRLVSVLDVSERVAAERELKRLATHDELTGLPNRRLFLNHVDLAVERRRAGRSIAVISIDLDQFRFVNEGCGYELGDQVLVEVGRRFRGALRRGETLARVGADEFAVVAEGVADRAGAMVICDRLAWALETPVRIDDSDSVEIAVAASQGVAIVEDYEGAAQVLQRSESGMRLAKDRGGNRSEFADASLQVRAAGRFLRQQELRRAIQRDELVVYYQPVVALATGEIVGAEALVRWLHPRDGLVGPDSFIPMAEDSGLIVGLGEWVLQCPR